MKNLIKRLFSKPVKKIEPDGVRNVVSFTDLNKQTIQFTIKHHDGTNLLIITAEDSESNFCVVLDQDTSVVLKAVLEDFNATGNVKNIASIINGEK